MAKTFSKPKILIVHNYYQIPGGEDTVVANEKRLLENQGHEVVLYSRNNSELKKMSNFQKLCLPFTTVFSLRTYKEIKKKIKQHSIDIVHVHNTLNLISPSVYYAAFSCNVPVVQTIHNFRFLCPAATFYRNGKICEDCTSKGLKCAIKYSCYRGSKLQTMASVFTLKVHRYLGTYKKLNYICLTEFNKEKLLQLNKGKKQIIDPNNVHIKPNFVDSETDCIPYEQRKNQFVFAGRIDKLKGIRILLETWKDIKDYELIICGTGPEEDWCKKYIEENKMVNVKMLGYVRNEDVKKIIGESKALILPTQWYEGFPMSIVESLSSGTPIIGSNIGNVGSLIETGVTGFKFKFDSSSELKNAVNQLVDMTSSSTNYYRNYLSEKRNYMILSAIYKNVIN
ncbi:glycosyltransferase family 4 protein [Bacillus sp. UNC41MFS5]|uniref:glycosyltransferase family 4 protein n=1 Tax=Bacillus sp. UNC41MFS5 TaxID=1449046 RepID=UPI000478D760|nr:glycosyltransferase family 4 protein [Bacillus sp. UNC41MFS5]